MKKLIASLLIYCIGASTAYAQADWSRVWKSELKKNYLRLDSGTQGALMAVYEQLGFQPQFTFYEDQYKIENIIQLQSLISSHGLNPSDYQFNQIAQNPRFGNEEREIRIVLELLRLAQDISAGRVEPQRVAPHVKFEAKGLSKIREVVELIRQPTQRSLDALAPRYKGYDELRTLLATRRLSAEEREKVILSMEKYRWLPDAPAMRYIIVSSATTMMRLEDPQLPFNSPLRYQKVITGQSQRPTPTMADAIKNVVLNPTWTVAANQEIWNKDKLPKLKSIYNEAEAQAPGTGKQAIVNYLNEHGYAFISISNYREIDPYSIDWENLSPYVPVNFTLRQSAGDDNALGVVKFPLAHNKDNIYLHDTGSRQLFANSDRNLSSGCVRISYPLELAEYLMEGSRWDYNSILEYTEKTPQNERREKYEKPYGNKSMIPVYIMSMTAEVIDGQVKFGWDLYGEDAGLKRELQRNGYRL